MFRVAFESRVIVMADGSSDVEIVSENVKTPAKSKQSRLSDLWGLAESCARDPQDSNFES